MLPRLFRNMFLFPGEFEIVGLNCISYCLGKQAKHVSYSGLSHDSRIRGKRARPRVLLISREVMKTSNFLTTELRAHPGWEQ